MMFWRRTAVLASLLRLGTGLSTLGRSSLASVTTGRNSSQEGNATAQATTRTKREIELRVIGGVLFCRGEVVLERVMW